MNDLSPKMITCLSIDIASKNCAFYKERFSPDDLKKIVNVPKAKRYTVAFPNGDHLTEYVTPQFRPVLDKVYTTGTRVSLQLVDFADGLSLKRGERLASLPIILARVTKYLYDHLSEWDNCAIILIEEQVKMNPIARQIEHHISAFFRIIYAGKIVVSIPANRKTIVSGARKKLKPAQRKDYAVKLATRILGLRNDLQGMKEVMSFKKSDDVSDAICQLQVFKYLVYIEQNIAGMIG